MIYHNLWSRFCQQAVQTCLFIQLNVSVSAYSLYCEAADPAGISAVYTLPQLWYDGEDKAKISQYISWCKGAFGRKAEDKMIHERYTDTAKRITNSEQLELTDTGEVLIYCGDKWHGEVTVNLQGREDQFEELKQVIVYIAKNLCKIDLTAQRYNALYGDGKFAYSYEMAYICLEPSDKISVRYYGIQENTEFDVVFQCANEEFRLKSFGMMKNIPPDWNRE